MTRIIAIAVLGLFTAGTALAAHTPNLDRREALQGARILQGVRSGQLNGLEAVRLTRAEVRLHANEARAKSDGVVTAGERARLQAEAQRTSARIWRQKHDAQVAR